jgi:hypothetical protein
MARRGRKRKLHVEPEYWRLVLSGVGTVEACRTVGIGHKTGDRWRAEHGGHPPEKLGEHERSGRYLSLLERQRIATLHERGLGVREIADRLSRAASTISRELRGNTLIHNRAGRGDHARMVTTPMLAHVEHRRDRWSTALHRSRACSAQLAPASAKILQFYAGRWHVDGRPRVRQASVAG